MKTRVLVVDDSPLIRAVLREAFERTHDIEVVGEAGDGRQAIERVLELRPDIVTMDMVMPVMDGPCATAEIMRVRPTPIVIIARDGGNSRALAVEALGKGALAVFPKPAAGFDDALALELAVTVRRLASEAGQSWRFFPLPSTPAEKIRVLPVDDWREPRLDPIHPVQVSIAGIVGSTGAPRVLRDLVCGLPADFPVPVVIVQHTERGYAESFAHWLSLDSPLPVRLGREGQVLVAGEIVVAPDDAHMEIHTGGVVALRTTSPVNGFRPSATVLLTSLAATFRQHSLGLVLSGMGSDGADGLGAIYSAGGCAIVEDPDTATMPGMPKRALARATGAHIEPASRLAWLLMELVGSGRNWKYA